MSSRSLFDKALTMSKMREYKERALKAEQRIKELEIAIRQVRQRAEGFTRYFPHSIETDSPFDGDVRMSDSTTGAWICRNHLFIALDTIEKQLEAVLEKDSE